MAALVRNVDRLLTKTGKLLTFSRSIRGNVVSKESSNISNIVDEDRPISLKNPYGKEKRLCILCKLNIEPDWKNARLLSQFQSTYTGRIYGRHITGLCAVKQMKVEAEILKSQNAGLMGYYMKEPKWIKDPKLFDPDNPFKPHKY